MKSKILIGCILFIVSFFSFIIWNQQDNNFIDIINKDLAATPSSSGKPVFHLLDATNFIETMYPWLGFPVSVISEQELLGAGDHSNTPPDKFKIKQKLIKYKETKRIILDIPSWKVSMGKDEGLVNKRYIEWFLQVINCVREVAPEADIGVFGLPYSPWIALKSNNNLQSYQSIHLSLQPIIDATDTIYPYFQVFTDNNNDLSYLMGAQLYIAKTSGKPVYPIVSHKKNISEINKNKMLPVSVIKQQCEFIRQNADGMVWWSSRNETWDDTWYEQVAKLCFL